MGFRRAQIVAIAVVTCSALTCVASSGGPATADPAPTRHFPIGLYHVGFGVASDPNDDVSGQALLDDLQNVADAGFNLIDAMPDTPDLVPFAQKAQDLGVNIIFSKDGTDADWEDVIPVLRNFPSVVGYSTGDDVNTGSYPLSQAKADSERLKALDPTRAVYMSGGGFPGYPSLYQWSKYADLIGVQSYPICNEPDNVALQRHYVYMARGYNTLGRKGKHWYVNGQAFAWDDPACTDRVPTQAQYRNMMFAALANGASGILNYTYFDGGGDLHDNHPAFWSTVTAFNNDVRTIEPFLLDGTLTRVPKIHGGYWIDGNRLLLVMLNTNTKRAQKINLTLPSGWTGALVPALSGYPTGMVNNGGLVTGSLAPEAVQVYTIDR